MHAKTPPGTTTDQGREWCVNFSLLIRPEIREDVVIVCMLTLGVLHVRVLILCVLTVCVLNIVCAV
jgi:hypothetical protein